LYLEACSNPLFSFMYISFLTLNTYRNGGGTVNGGDTVDGTEEGGDEDNEDDDMIVEDEVLEEEGGFVPASENPYLQQTQSNGSTSGTATGPSPPISTGLQALRPMLKGKYTRVGPSQVQWEGLWGMGPEAFLPGGFAQKMKYNAAIPKPFFLQPFLLNSELHSPIMYGYDCTVYRVKPEETTINSEIMSPLFIGYSKDPKQNRAYPPVSCGYAGHFVTRLAPNPANPSVPLDKKITEAGLKFAFFQNGPVFRMEGIGKNVYGWFTLQGTYNPADLTLDAYKAYLPLNVVPPSPIPASAIAAAPKSTNKLKLNMMKRKSLATPKRPAGPPKPKKERSTPLTTNSSVVNELMTPDLNAARGPRRKIVPSYLRDTDSKIFAGVASYMPRCEQLLEEMMKFPNAIYFDKPVDPVALNLPDYFDIIKNPMDLGTALSNVKNGTTKNIEEFDEEVSLVFSNCKLYNPPTSMVHGAAVALEKEFEVRIRSLRKQIGDEEIAAKARERERLRMEQNKMNMKVGGGGGLGVPMNRQYEDDMLSDDFSHPSKKVRRDSLGSYQMMQTPRPALTHMKSSTSVASSGGMGSAMMKKRPRADSLTYDVPIAATPIAPATPAVDIQALLGDVALQVSEKVSRDLKAAHQRELSMLKAQLADMQMRLMDTNATVQQVQQNAYVADLGGRGGMGASIGGGERGGRGGERASAPVNRDKVPLSYEEKKTLSAQISKLPPEKVEKVIQIIQDRMDLNDANPEEIEVDMETLDTPTLRQLQKYVKSCQASTKKRRTDGAAAPKGHRMAAASAPGAGMAHGMSNVPVTGGDDSDDSDDSDESQDDGAASAAVSSQVGFY
jgi:hypothetical protein